MTCDRQNIQEVLPAYLAGTLGSDDRVRVEEHLAACRDCTAELDLLRMMATEPVPDPGEGFWEALPHRIYPEVQRQRRRQWPSRLSDLLRGANIPRWGWAAAAAAVILASWLVVRPLPDRALRAAAKHRPAPAVDIIQEASNNTEIRPEDLERLSTWAHQELLSLQDGLADLSANGNGTRVEGALNVDLEDELASLSDEQLETLIDTLDRGSHDEDTEDPEEET